MSVLVTGGADTSKALIKQGFDTIILDNFSSGKRELIPEGTSEVIEKDLGEKESIIKTFKEHDIEAVLHFASLIQVGESYNNPHKYYTANPHIRIPCSQSCESLRENKIYDRGNP